MDKATSFKFIRATQRRWAASCEIAVAENGRVFNLEDNLFANLQPQTKIEISEGDGDEFGKPETPGKMFSLWSSSALACNVFDYWRERPLGPLLAALDIAGHADTLRFEQKFPTGVGSRPANLDVLIGRGGPEGVPILIESKFTEPYQSRKKEWLSPSYFRNETTWDRLAACNTFAKESGAAKFAHLDAGQLLKHIVALTRRFGSRRFILVNLWYDVEGSEAAKQHKHELVDFSRLVADEVLFRAETYQNLFGRLSPHIMGTSYEEYLRSRYFGTCKTVPDGTLDPSTRYEIRTRSKIKCNRSSPLGTIGTIF